MHARTGRRDLNVCLYTSKYACALTDASSSLHLCRFVSVKMFSCIYPFACILFVSSKLARNVFYTLYNHTLIPKQGQTPVKVKSQAKIQWGQLFNDLIVYLPVTSILVPACVARH